MTITWPDGEVREGVIANGVYSGAIRKNSATIRGKFEVRRSN
ncbi:hypothetical protein U91I_02440 [alpha proteobacterium U9-1i]|nr:hypothetical protein U91I_02440 [alpha proteobacterium U9-1i]